MQVRCTCRHRPMHAGTAGTFSSAVSLQPAHFGAKFIVINAKFIVFNAKLIVFNSKISHLALVLLEVLRLRRTCNHSRGLSIAGMYIQTRQASNTYGTCDGSSVAAAPYHHRLYHRAKRSERSCARGCLIIYIYKSNISQ